ncbi:Putative 2-hydroxyacid dehydrogenase [Pirellulimonas nuda]|uniref:2-hydroxyacid dehydrogenase n=1 Tax=Pirellulimonas nuda TaxID=2528009 RepID=A0A518DGL5_9BACT|nr:C-terminal binding protein [Pirellulimonas nuda]QDU90620.1 Putative 2-hydroxyacid dehydrogenase [Pirellulimonas nuda]
MPNAFYTDHPWADVEVERAILSAAGIDLREASNNQEATLAAQVGDADAIITCWAPTTARVIDAAPNLRHIARTGVGLDNIDVARATERGVVVTNVPDYCVTEVAEHTIGLAFAMARKIAECAIATRAGRYSLVDAEPYRRIAGQTFGVIGLGRIGSRVAEMARALGCRVLGNNRSGSTPEGVAWAPLDQLLAESDFVALLAPLTDETHKMINDRTLALMKPDAFLINTSRGGLVDHDALARTLAQGRLAGVALDVQTPEPPDLSAPPYNHPRVLVTPHTAFVSTQSMIDLRTRVAHQVAAVLAGEQPENVVN